MAAKQCRTINRRNFAVVGTFTKEFTMAKKRTNEVVDAIFPAPTDTAAPAGWSAIEGDEQLIELDASDLMLCLTAPTEEAASLPCLNHGRESAAAWANPWAIVPQDLYHGWNLHLGTIIVIPLADLDRLGVTSPTSFYYPSAADAAADYQNRLIANVAKMVPESGLHYCVGSSLNAQTGKVDDRDTVLTRADLVKYLQSLTIRPRYVAISAQRRTMAAHIANWLRLRDGKQPLRLPCIVRTYETLQALHVAQTDDNRDNSKAAYDAAGVISNYILWLNDNPMQAAKTLALRAGVAVGTGQKCHALTQLARQRDLPIVDRLRLPPTTKNGKIVYEPFGHINFSALDKECCRGLAGQIEKLDSLPDALKSVFIDEHGRFSAQPYQRIDNGQLVDCPPTWQPGKMANAVEFERYVALAMNGSTRSAALDKARATKLLAGLSLQQRLQPVTVGYALRAMLAGDEVRFSIPAPMAEQETIERNA